MLKALVTAIFLTISHYHHHSSISSSRDLLSSNQILTAMEQTIQNGFVNRLTSYCDMNIITDEEAAIKIPLHDFISQIQLAKNRYWRHSIPDQHPFSFYIIDAFIYMQKYIRNNDKQITWINVHMLMLTALSISIKQHNSPSTLDICAYRDHIAQLLPEESNFDSAGMYLFVIHELSIQSEYSCLTVYRFGTV